MIAQGTSDQLKNQIGGDLIELQVTDPAQLEEAAAVLAGLENGEPQTDRVQRRVTVPAKGGAKTLVATARGLDDAGIELDDLGLRRPSLDDVPWPGRRGSSPSSSRWPSASTAACDKSLSNRTKGVKPDHPAAREPYVHQIYRRQAWHRQRK